MRADVFRFEGMEVRESEYSLTRGGETVTVEPTAFRVLIYLLRNAGRLVTKDEIIHARVGQAFVPPSTVRLAPVMYEASGLATKATSEATSSTVP